MIILLDAEAAKVRGISPANRQAALEPVVLKDGTFELHEDVLSDAAHADVKGFLAALLKRTVLPTETYGKGDIVPVTPTWKDVGVRK